MKSMLSFSLALAAFSMFAQTPIDGLQQRNLSFLEQQERDGFDFRSQIITEFDQSHASQHVNIKLAKGYTYVIVALGDSNIPEIVLDIKPAKNASLEAASVNGSLAGQAYLVTPSRSGRFKIDINARELDAHTGFISFMVLRKE